MPLRQIRKVNKLLIMLFALMSLVLVGSLGFAIAQNWQLKVESTNSELAKQAGIGNFIVENAIANASKSLSAAQKALNGMVSNGHLGALQVHEVLERSLDEFNAYSNSNYEGLLLYLDENGELVARTDMYPAERISLADRDYFQHLSEHPELERTLGQLVKARTSGEWVFHVAIPLKDKQGHFRGVLAQQIRAIDIARELIKYIDTHKTSQMVSQSVDGGLSFVYPLQWLSIKAPQEMRTPYADFAIRSTSPQDAFIWTGESEERRQPRLLVGYAHSEQSGLLTTIHLVMSDVWFDFFIENLALLGIALMALVLISILFRQLYRLSNQLSSAVHDSFYDTLTQIPNRRAMDDMFPRLLREAMRSREPLSVLFIDIDHFKQFNDQYGHDGGDIALKAVAQTLQNCAARPLDFVCRWGGEEFVVILPRTPETAAIAMAEKILAAIRDIRLQDQQGKSMRHVSVSIGLSSTLVASSRLGEQLITQADEAMQHAKQAGRDRCISHQPPGA